MIVKSMSINPMKNIKKIVYHLNKIVPLALDMEIIIRKKTKFLHPKLIPNKIMPSYDESMIEKIYKNGGL